ncbi:MAG TPA: tryptophan synthase subunit alpha [Gammaproteobacteria bacterium]|nr:tryptophan synthase subunit alpha [Gammaproteobacteria bacterium]
MRPREERLEPREAVAAALRRGDGPSIVAGLTAGYPDPDRFIETLDAIAGAADVVEICVPFSDPMADGITIQRSSRAAIERGVSLTWIFDELARRGPRAAAPLIFMSYLNPLLAFGYERLAERAAETGVGGFIVPDLPLEESGPLAAALDAAGLALVQLVTPATPAERLRRLCEASTGFVYAVTRTGITGAGQGLKDELAAYLDAVKSASSLPVCAGFGVRTPEHVELIGRHADGVIVASALVELLERGGDPAAFLVSLRGGRSASAR